MLPDAVHEKAATDFNCLANRQQMQRNIMTYEYQEYDPNRRFADTTDGVAVPMLFVSPTQYIQSPGAIHRLGLFLADLVGPEARVGVLITPGRRRAVFAAVADSVGEANLTMTEPIPRPSRFGRLAATAFRFCWPVCPRNNPPASASFGYLWGTRSPMGGTPWCGT